MNDNFLSCVCALYSLYPYIKVFGPLSSVHIEVDGVFCSCCRRCQGLRVEGVWRRRICDTNLALPVCFLSGNVLQTRFGAPISALNVGFLLNSGVRDLFVGANWGDTAVGQKFATRADNAVCTARATPFPRRLLQQAFRREFYNSIV